MRNSLQKIPPSGPRSMPSLPAALLAVGVRQSAAKRQRTGPYTGVPRVRVAVEEGPGDDGDLIAARLRLLEGFVGRSELADCAHLALQWLGEVLGISQSICVVRPADESSLFVVGTHGLAGSVASRFSVSLDDWGNPLVTAFASRKEFFFPAPHSAADRKRRPATPFEDSAFQVVPLGVSGFSEDAFGLLLVSGMTTPPELHWFTNIFSQKLDQILRQQMLADGDRKLGRERSLLY